MHFLKFKNANSISILLDAVCSGYEFVVLDSSDSYWIPVGFFGFLLDSSDSCLDSSDSSWILRVTVWIFRIPLGFFGFLYR